MKHGSASQEEIFRDAGFRMFTEPISARSGFAWLTINLPFDMARIKEV